MVCLKAEGVGDVKPGNIAFFMTRTPTFSGRKTKVWYGLLEYIEDGYAYVSYLIPRESRMVHCKDGSTPPEGIPYDEFCPSKEWKPAPKGFLDAYFAYLGKEPKPESEMPIWCTWSPPDLSGVRMDAPETILRAYKDGRLMKSADVFSFDYPSIKLEKRGGKWYYRYVRNGSNMPSHDSHGETGIKLPENRVYETYAEAVSEMEAFLAEQRRYASLSEREQCDEDNRKRFLNFFTPESVERAINFFHLFEDYEVLDFKISREFSDNGQYVLYYRNYYEKLPSTHCNVRKTGRKGLETKVEREKRLAEYAAGAKDRFFAKWTPLFSVPMEVRSDRKAEKGVSVGFS